MSTPRTGRLWVRLHEKGGKDHDMPCHHHLDEALAAYVAYLEANDLANGGKGPLFRTIGRGTKKLTRTSPPRPTLMR